MIKEDEAALICDLAQTYQIYDYRQLPPMTVAVFSYGLPDSSRIKLKLSNQTVPLETLLLASISDKLSLLLWFQTKDGQKGNNRPTAIVDSLIGSLGTNNDKEIMAFESGEEFERTRNELLSGGER